MFKTQIFINAVDKIKEFENKISRIDCDCDLVSGRYVIDAKSIMGIFSLNLSKPIDFVAHSDDPKILEAVKEAVKPFEA